MDKIIDTRFTTEEGMSLQEYKDHLNNKFPVDPLKKLIEECSELIQAICKVQRFGWLSYHPNRPNSKNIDEVYKEIEDVRDAILTVQHMMIAVRYTGKDNENTGA